ncbi:MAG: CocE/NonD family hydrolase, partial [Gemmatimonadaceae bacterium]|nr:CocE/NonD family hydrolase [Gemmatimonadaceae bacterium]
RQLCIRDRPRAAHPAVAPSDSTPADTSVAIAWGVKIPMRDGVMLNATVYRPGRQQGPLPAVFTFTPYISDSYHDRAMYFARHGYVYALVDVRGRGNSGGTFEPFVNEGHDGYDVVEWLAKQPWCDGKVAMWGGSYAGFDQWTTAKELPPHLATIVPVASAYPGLDFPFYGNIFGSYDIQWLTLTSGVTPNDRLFGDESFWAERFRTMYTKHLRFAALDSLVGNTSTMFQRWIAHPAPDAYWDAMAPTPAQYAKLSIPILTITGHYDGDQRGALMYYRSHIRYGNAEARAKHYLIIGPWDHAGTRTPRKEVGGVTFGDASLLDLNDLHRQWYDWTMKGGAKPKFLEKRAAYYVPGAGAERWKYADSLDAIATEHRTLYLTSTNGSANDVFASGRLVDAPPRRSAPDHWVYDPLDTLPGVARAGGDRKYLLDQRAALNLFGEGVVYHTAPFAEATEITGSLRLVLWISMDVPDTDFQIVVYEVLPDGTSIALTDAALRARYRESLREAKPVPAGAIVRYTFDNFQYFSRRIAKGSRLRLVIASSNSPDAEKNYNSGGVVAQETAEDARTAHITLYHDAQHPSALEIPIVREAPVVK